MKRKTIAMLMVASMTVALFAGCGSKSDESDSGKVKLTFLDKHPEDEYKGYFEEAIADFEKENPDIKVDFMHIPQNYFQKIHLLFASNTAPDVIFMNNQYLPIYANAGVLEDLTNDFDFSKFYPQTVKALSWKGKIYAVPRDVSNLVIFYNKDTGFVRVRDRIGTHLINDGQ